MATEPSADVVFEDPPGPRYDWSSIAAKLKANPNEWATVFQQDKTSLYESVRSGRIVVLRPEAGFEVRSSRNKRLVDPDTGKQNRVCKMHLRYVPAKDTTIPTTKKGRK